MEGRTAENKQGKGFMGLLETIDLRSDADRSINDVPPSSHISKKQSDDDFHAVKFIRCPMALF